MRLGQMGAEVVRILYTKSRERASIVEGFISERADGTVLKDVGAFSGGFIPFLFLRQV